MNTTSPCLTPLAREYDDHGYIVVPGLLGPDECARLKQEARRVLDEHGRPGASVHLHVAVVSPLFRALSEDERVLAVLRQIMPDGIMFLSDKIVYKEAAKSFATPWHIDAFYWRNTRPKLSVWIPLDDATAENGTLTVVPGSHKQDWQMVKKGLNGGEFLNEISGEDMAGAPVTVCEIERGTAVFFTDRLVHGSTENTAGTDRYAIISTYHAPGEDEPFDLGFPARRVVERGNH